VKKLLFIVSLLILGSPYSIGQIDSIEYNIAEKIFDFELVRDSFYFRSYIDGQIIEADSLIFNSNTYFSNFIRPERLPIYEGYEDSVQLALITRTLKGYNEKILYNRNIDFVRICFFTEENPTILTLYLNEKRYSGSYKIGNGWYECKGNIVKETDIQISGNKNHRIEKKLAKFNLFDQPKLLYAKEKIPWASPKMYFIEIKLGTHYNVFGIPYCYENTKMIRKLSKFNHKVLSYRND